MAAVTMRELLEAGIHFGHQTRRWNPKMKKFIFGERNGIYIIDLQKTLRQVNRSQKKITDVVARGGNVLFVGTKKQAREAVQREAQRCGMYYVNNRWLGGTLTNWATIRNSIATLLKYEDWEKTGKIEQYSKKEGIQIRKQRAKLDKNLAGIKRMEKPPALMFVIDAKREAIAIREAERMGIPCIAVVDTNADPDVVPYPIPGNDDAIRAINLFCEMVSNACLDGRAIGEKLREEEEQAEAEAANASAALAESQAESETETADDSKKSNLSELEAAAVAADSGSGNEPDRD